jgi:hypothetical protein
MKSYISYNLFRNRTKFNPLSLFFSNNDISYEEFKIYFNSKDIESPDFEYYNRVKDKFEASNIKNTELNVALEEDKNEEKIFVNKAILEKQDKVRKKKKQSRKKKDAKDENN